MEKNNVDMNWKKEIISLYNKGLSVSQIAEKLNSSYSTVLRYLYKNKVAVRGNRTRISNKNYHRLTPEKAYILGVIGPGDGFIEYRKKGGIYRIVLEAVNRDFINYFVYCLERVYEINPRIEKVKVRRVNENPRLKVVLQSKEVAEDILSYDCDFKEKTWRIPKTIKESSRKLKAKYLQGFADSQACVSKKSILFCNQNNAGLIEMKNLMNNIGFDNVREGKVGLILCDRKSIELFTQLVNFNIGYKKERLKREMANYKLWKTREEEMNSIKPKIIELRNKGLSYPEISELCNVSISSAWRHSKEIEKPGRVYL